MTPLAPTPGRLRFFDTFGFLHLAGLFADEIGEIDAAVEAVMAANGGGDYAGEHRFTVSPGINADARLVRLLFDHAGLRAHVAALLGEDFQYWNSDLNFCAGDTPWHSDSPWSGERRTAGWLQVLIHLDPLDAATGALRVVPGSHRESDRFGREVHAGIVDDAAGRLRRTAETWDVGETELPAVAIPTRPGDAILLDHLTAHASFGGAARRRLINLVFFPRLADDALDRLRAVNAYKGLTRRRVFGPGCALLADGPVERARHLEQLRATVLADPSPLARSFGLPG